MQQLLDPEHKEQLKKDLFARIDLLPQRDAIEMDDAKQWVEYVVNVMPNLAMWHITRASGIGGSEIGALVKNYLGHPADFMFSAHDWAKHKLLRITPEPSGGSLRRGIELEPIHRQHFHHMYKVFRDQRKFEKLNQSQAKGRPWLRYSADDLITVPSSTVIDFGEQMIEVDGSFLIDYKAPTNISKQVAFQYACQLHQGAIICEDNDIELQAGILSQWDLQEWRPHNDLVMINPELKDMIKQSSDYYWDCVLRGEIPDYVFSKRFSLDEDDRQDWNDMVHHLGTLNALKSQIEKRSAETRARIEEGLNLNEYRLESQKIEFKGALNISAVSSIDDKKIRELLTPDEIASISVKETTTKYDTPALVRHMKANGLDVKPFRIQTKLDPEKTFDLLVEKGLNAQEYISESLRFNTDRGLTAQANLWLDQNLPTPEQPTSQKNDQFDLTPTADSIATQELLMHEGVNAPLPQTPTN